MEPKKNLTEQEVLNALEYAENIIDAVPEPLLVLDGDLRVISASKSFYDFFKVDPVGTVRQLVYDIGNHQWNIPKLKELLEAIIPNNAAFDNFEVEHDFPSLGKRIMLLNARQISQKTPGSKKMILITIENITDAKIILDGLHEKISKLESSLRLATGKDRTIAGLKGMVDDLQRKLLRKSG